jgi:RNA polymerase sigma-70 factor (ECF subfamily)
MNSLTDEQLMEYYQMNKDGRGAIAFDHLYNRYAKRMVNFFYYSLKCDYAKAQDFLHNLYLKIIENKHKFDKSQSFQAWIFRIATNMCKNEFRSNSINKKYHEYVKYTAELIDTGQTFINDLQAHINSLEQEQRALIILRFKFNLTVKEISNIFECAEGTIKSRLFYATKELSKIYNK